MTISFPLTFPSISRKPASIVIAENQMQDVTRSPFSGIPTVTVWPGAEWFEMHVVLPPLKLRADAEELCGWFSALNGQDGSFTMGPFVGKTPRGTWVGQSPLVQGAGQSGKSLFIDGMTDGSTIKRGDWFQLGSGSTARLYKIAQDVTVGGSPTGTAQIDFWPSLRVSPADNAALTLASPLGLWMLAAAKRQWSIGEGQIYGFEFDAIEDLRGL